MPLAYIRDPNAEYKLPSYATVRAVIGKQIKQLRKEHRMSQKELALNLGQKSAAYIAFLENGERNLSAAQLARLAVHFKVDLSYFYPTKR